ncbi:MAG: hypothetical protein RJA09_1562 [Pseudomonadota bacterium]
MAQADNPMGPMTLPAPLLEHVCDLVVSIAQPIDVGCTPSGQRRVIPITGGLVRGPLLNGKVMSAGADFQLLLSGGTQAHLDARYVLELDDGARVFVQNTALRVTSVDNAQRIINGQPVPPEQVYFRCQPRMEVSSPKWSWVNDSQFVGTGYRAPDGVFLSFYRVL